MPRTRHANLAMSEAASSKAESYQDTGWKPKQTEDRRRSSCFRRPLCPVRIAPVDPLQKIAELRRRRHGGAILG